MMNNSDTSEVLTMPVIAESKNADQKVMAGDPGLRGKRVGMVVFSSYPADPRPRRAAEALLKEGMHVDYLCEADEKSPKRERIGNLEVIRLPIKHFRGSKFSY